MEKKTPFTKILIRLLSYVLVAALASGATWCVASFAPVSKLDRLSTAIDRKFIGDADKTTLEDTAAEAMIAALGDRWSYYISADEYAAHLQRQDNAYVGIGVTILHRSDGTGIDIVEVNPDGPAAEAGVLAGDIFTHADGTFLGDLTTEETRSLIMGPKNTSVTVTLLRDGVSMDLKILRKVIHSQIVEGQMLSDTVGYIKIENFHSNAGKDTIAEIEKLQQQGAQKLIFDVRGNPGGYVHEMVKLLDYLLPEGPLFCSVDYKGREDVDQSDADCLELPMAVLMDGDTYSAAEFFAAALWEYDWATTVGEPTTGKGYYQTTIELGDGSAVQLSTGAYTTPKGVNLTEIGGLQPDVPVLPAETAVAAEEDPQILAAMAVLEDQNK